MTDDYFTIDHKNGEIKIKCDPDVIDDLVSVLNNLLSFARTLKVRDRHARACRVDPEDIKRRHEAFNDKSTIVFNRFVDHLNNGCHGDKRKALQEIKKDFNLMSCDAQIYVTQGRKLSKIRRN